VQLTTWRKFFTDVADKFELAGKPGKVAAVVPKGIQKISKVFDDALWRDYHSPNKLNAFEILSEEMIKLKDAPKNKGQAFYNNLKNNLLLKNVRAKDIAKMPTEQIQREIASLVNDAYGGQVWELMQAKLMRHPKMRQLMHLAMLAPDWMISQLRIFGDLFATKAPVKQNLAVRYWRNAVIVYATYMNMINYLLTSTDPDPSVKPHFMWENEPGRRLDIQLWSRDKKGKRRFLRPGKQFRETMELAHNPAKWFGNKASPLVSTITEQVAGVSPSGFPTLLTRAREKGFVPIGQELKLRAQEFSEDLIPLSIKGDNALLSFPTRRGINTFTAQRMLERAIISGDIKTIGDIKRAMRDNGYKESTIKSIEARARHRIRISKEQ
jgi:hypothetical protein